MFTTVSIDNPHTDNPELPSHIAFVRYTPDEEDDAYYNSPEGLRASARALREEAQQMILKAEEKERQANGK